MFSTCHQAAVILSLSLTAIEYVPVSQREPNSLYTSFSGLFVIYMVFVVPVYLTVEVMFSAVIERLLNKQKGIPTLSMHFMYIGWYSFAGILSTLLFFLFFLRVPDLIESLKFMMLGMVAAILYFHLSLLWRSFVKGKQTSIYPFRHYDEPMFL